MQQLLSQSLVQMQFNDKLTEQLSNLERSVMTCQMALEQVHHKIDTMGKLQDDPFIMVLCSRPEIFLFCSETVFIQVDKETKFRFLSMLKWDHIPLCIYIFDDPACCLAIVFNYLI